MDITLDQKGAGEPKIGERVNLANHVPQYPQFTDHQQHTTTPFDESAAKNHKKKATGKTSDLFNLSTLIPNL